jgi:hypothetical protein
MSKCCAKVVLFDPQTMTKDMSFRCINKGIAAGNVEMTIDQFNVQLTCLESAATKTLLSLGAFLCLAGVALV